MASPMHYDAIILGSGQAGSPLASAFAKAGKKTALIESTHIGGCCVNEGCTPTKTMVASGRVAYLARRGQDYGVLGADKRPIDVTVDMTKVRQRKRDIVDQFRSGGEKRVKEAGVDVYMGEGSFSSAKELNVKMKDGSEKKVSGDLIFINTGERPARPKLDGVDGVPSELVLDSTSIQELGEVPRHLVVMGGGYIALEFGQLFRRLGAEVTIIQRGSQLLPREDKDIAEAMLEIVKEDGITVHLNSNAKRVSQSSNGNPLTVTIENKQGQKDDIHGSHLLFAAGRVPNTDMLNLAKAGVKSTDRGHIITNEKLETNVEGIYTLGDVKGPPAFTHVSYDDFRIIRNNIIDKSVDTRTIEGRILPYVVYTDPQLGHVGFHEHELRSQFPDRKIKVAKMPMAYVARALETDEKRGLMKAIIDAETGEILGYTCLGIEGGETMSVVQMAMMGGVHWEKLRDAVWAHPALAESLNNLWGFLE